MNIAITGATGGIGSRVAARLEAEADLRLLVRNPERAPQISDADVHACSYDDGEALRRALSGVDALLFVSAHEDPDRVALHRGVVEAAADAGVGRVVYTSFLNAAPDCTFTFGRDHFHTEQLIRDAGLVGTFLRDSLYLDFLPMMGGEQGVIRGPAGDGQFAPVARDDIADVAAIALLDDSHAGATYDMTGPELVTMSDVAQRLTALSGRTITFRNETLEEAYASRAHYGAPAFEVDGWVTSYSAIAAGELAVVSQDIERVTGHPATSIEDYFQRYPLA